MANIFQNIFVPKVRKSVFDLSYENKLSFDMGQLVPIYQENVVPGDKFKVNSEVFLRFAPMLAPIMHRVNCYVHYFFVPYRLIWEDWQEFITGGEDGLSQPVFPRAPFTEASTYYRPGTLADYLGYNFPNDANLSPSIQEYGLLPFRAYQFIYNEFYRDQNLTEPVSFSLASGDHVATSILKGTKFEEMVDPLDPDTLEAAKVAATHELMSLRYRAWEKDYFTSALPFVQRGVASQVPITLDTSNLRATFDTGINSINTTNNSIDKAFNKATPSATLPGDDIYIRTDGTISTGDSVELMFGNSSSTVGQHLHSIMKNSVENAVRITENEKGLTITPPTINELRLAEHIQRWLEKNARGGARYVEQILSHFGVRVPDYRLDRPEYLGGGKSPVQISEVLQTSSSDDVTPQGNMAGHAYSVGNKNQFKYTFDEHGIVLGIISVLPRTSYQDGISRHLMKFDKFDFYFPEFAHLGEQEIKNCEIYNGTTIDDNPLGTWGYQERYAEYKYHPGETHGDFKTTLDFWHMGRKFNSTPELNTSFVQSSPTSRIFNVLEGNHMWCQVYNSVRAIRPMPKHAIPSL